jgi:CBS domain-containing protein
VLPASLQPGAPLDFSNLQQETRMNVREVLQSKKEAIVTIDVEDTIGAAAHKMSAHKIAALVVMKDDAPVRIISEKDIVRSLAEDGPQAGRRVISSLPSAGLEGIAPDATLKQAMALMTYSRHRHLMVTENAKLVGILSLGDIVKNLLTELELEKAVLQDIYMAAH